MMRDLHRAELADGAARLGVELDHQRLDALLAYLSLLEKWNRVYNLTAVRDPSQMLIHHLLDSLAVVGPLLRQHALTGSTSLRMLDVGSGAGLPGVVLAVSLPESQVTCVDTVGKKASFVRQVAAELGIVNLRSEHARVEKLAPMAADVVTSRAFASLADFARLTRDHLAEDGIWMAMKGKPPNEEIASLTSDLEVFHVEQLQVPGLDAERCLVWMRPCGLAGPASGSGTVA